MCNLAHYVTPWRHQEACTEYEGALYAALHVLRQTAPDLATRLHDNTGLPPYAAYLDGCSLLWLSALTGELCAALNQSSLVQRSSAPVSYQSLIDTTEPQQYITLRFLSPFFVRSKSVCHVSPAPNVVFGAVLRRWLVITDIAVPEIQYDHIKITELAGETRRVRYRHHWLNGFVGRVRYRMQAPQRWIAILARFAEYSGVGSHTTQGWGHICLED
jgi:CRISPR-associated endoribonuclease Cas6